MSTQAVAGFELFASERLGCSACHGGYALTDSVFAADPPPFHNVGLPPQSYLPPNQGIAEVTTDPSDAGKFKAPTLRNIALTAPYMHDGTLQTLGEVLDHFATGGVSDGTAPEELTSFSLTATERDAVLAFLDALTDARFVGAPGLANPWTDD